MNAKRGILTITIQGSSVPLIVDGVEESEYTKLTKIGPAPINEPIHIPFQGKEGIGEAFLPRGTVIQHVKFAEKWQG